MPIVNAMKQVRPAYRPTRLLAIVGLGSLMPLLACSQDSKSDVRPSSGGTTLFQNALRLLGEDDSSKFLGAIADHPELTGMKKEGGVSLLMLACRNGKLSIVKELLTKGAPVNEVDEDGQTPLMHAIHSRKSEIVETLLEAGALTGAKDGSGDTALDRARILLEDGFEDTVDQKKQLEAMIMMLRNKGNST